MLFMSTTGYAVKSTSEQEIVGRMKLINSLNVG